MTRSSARDETLFTDALAQPAEDRSAFLDRVCGGDPDLRRRIEALIAAHESRNDWLDASATLLATFPEEKSGDRIGRYTLGAKLGEGGCGVVYAAEQEEPVRRRVALKVIKAGMDTREVIARFSAERQALALMDHPGIAKVFDAGATERGRPFFVMELVPGMPITRYCDEQKLATTTRLELFTCVCDAVQHAHHKGVIHRDLKPSNILVASSGGAAMPKVIDFGIAKATAGRLTDATLVTAVDQLIGTPAYMSPEQLDMDGLDIDTRADVYSLGVVLYELLVGRRPFDPNASAPRGEMRRIVNEEEPEKLSAQFRQIPDAERVSVAQNRSTDPTKLAMTLSGDLDWIVMKAMEKNRTRRYESAAALAADIARYLANEPVEARPPSKLYRFGKLVRRNRLVFAAAAAVALALIVGTIVSSWEAVRATRAERLASQERSRAIDERARAEDLLDFMLGDLRTQVQRVGTLDLLEMVGDKALAYFASLDPRELTDSALARHVKTLTQIAGVRMEQARYPEAQQAYRSAYARAAELASRNPKDGQVLFVRGQAEWGNSFVHWKRGEIAAATEWFVRYRDTTAALVALEPGNRSYRVEFISNGHNFAALATENGQFALARERFLDTRAALEALLAENPNDLEVRYQLADVTSWLGTIAERTGALTDAVRIFGDQAAQLEAIVDADPTMLQWRFKLSDALSFQAEVLAVIGRVADAQQTLARARELMEPLVARDDANRRWRHGLLVLHLKQAMLAKATGDAESARQSAALARDGYEQLVAAEPSNRAFSFRLAMALRVQSELLAASGNAEPAVALRAVTLGEKLIGQGRALSADVGECAQACIAAGRIAIAHGESEKALQLWRRAGELLAPRLREAADWRILDPAARVATLLGQRAEAADIVAQLTRIGYVPLEPWPDSADVFFTETPIKPPK